ncbi:hypothetical protein RYX36_002375 [Vicia faba]
MRVHTLDSNIFKECNFFKTLKELKLSKFICTPSKRVYPTFVKMFFSNLHPTDGIIHTEVRKHHINLSIEYFGRIIYLPYQNQPMEENNFDFVPETLSLIKKPSSYVPYPLEIKHIHPENRLNHYVFSHTLFPRKGILEHLNQMKVRTMWSLENKVTVNWAKQVIKHMIDCRKEKKSLPYKNLVTKILEETRYDLQNEEFRENSTIVEKYILSQIKIRLT